MNIFTVYDTYDPPGTLPSFCGIGVIMCYKRYLECKVFTMFHSYKA